MSVVLSVGFTIKTDVAWLGAPYNLLTFGANAMSYHFVPEPGPELPATGRVASSTTSLTAPIDLAYAISAGVSWAQHGHAAPRMSTATTAIARMVTTDASARVLVMFCGVSWACVGYYHIDERSGRGAG